MHPSDAFARNIAHDIIAGRCTLDAGIARVNGHSVGAMAALYRILDAYTRPLPYGR